MRYVLALPAAFLLGFAWHLGRRAASALVFVGPPRPGVLVRSRQRARPADGRQAYEPLYLAGTESPERFTVQ